MNKNNTYTGTNGCYVYRNVIPTIGFLWLIRYLTRWLNLPPLSSNEYEPHLTVMYSPKVPNETPVLDNNNVIVRPSGLTFFKSKTGKDVLVLLLERPENWHIYEREQLIKLTGCEPTFPKYRPHITLCDNYPDKSKIEPLFDEVNRIFSITYDVLLGGEKMQDIE
jgi:2'-5' RNA ligase